MTNPRNMFSPAGMVYLVEKELVPEANTLHGVNSVRGTEAELSGCLERPASLA